MKPNLILICLLIIISFYGCHKYDLNFTDEERAIFNTYDNGDTFSLIKNGHDTLKFVATNKTHYYEEFKTSNMRYECGSIELICDSDSGEICIKKTGTPSLSIHFFGIFSNYTKYQTLMINNKEYCNVLLMPGVYYHDTLYFSIGKGFIYVKLTDGTTYKLIE